MLLSCISISQHNNSRKLLCAIVASRCTRPCDPHPLLNLPAENIRAILPLVRRRVASCQILIRGTRASQPAMRVSRDAQRSVLTQMLSSLPHTPDRLDNQVSAVYRLSSLIERPGRQETADTPNICLLPKRCCATPIDYPRHPGKGNPCPSGSHSAGCTVLCSSSLTLEKAVAHPIIPKLRVPWAGVPAKLVLSKGDLPALPAIAHPA